MKVLFATSEATPLVKTGGLADVAGALPAALVESGVDVRVLLPGYGPVLESIAGRSEIVADLALPPFPPARLVAASMPSGVPLLVVDCPALFVRPGGPYQQPGGLDWPDNDIRFGLLSRVAALLAHESTPLPWRPDVLHCNDWQTGLAPAYLAFELGSRARTVMTIHNLAYQGIFLPGTLARVGLTPAAFQPEGVEYYGNVSYLKAGLHYADRLTTVSPTYAREIQTETLGFGMQGLLTRRADELTGIVNGIDVDVWNPATDPLIPRRYQPDTLIRKNDDKRALQQKLGLETDIFTPLAGIVSRFTDQKGLDLVLEAADRLLALPLQLAALGSGDPVLQDGFRALAARHPGQVGVQIGFDEALSHLVEAGADLFLMPSRFEPSGLNQMYSQRYGTPVVAHATGGLVDTITDHTPVTAKAGTASGFLFREPTADALFDAVERAVTCFHVRRTWRRIQRAGMGRDFSWASSAGQYVALYEALAG